ncbi:MAG TPA: histidine kinase, partial [Solirubrobacteraceae bacterium]|nr:histidine kinase [Solirubrobacteraceae bacterium]
MGIGRRLIGWARTVDLRVIDWVLAVLLTAGALADSSSQFHRGLQELAIVPLVLLTSSVAWRRVNPWRTTVLAVTAFMAFQLASGYTGGGAFEVAAIALNFYVLGRRARGRERIVGAAVVFAYWLVGVVVITYSQPGGSAAAVLGSWALLGGLPFAVGWTLETRRALTQELEASTARLADSQEDRAGRAAAEERHRMARELHDVIAHDVSVMVLQSSGARGVASVDIERAREAMRVVESAGRDALVELRRIVGVLHRGNGALAGSAAPGLSQLDALVDRARAAGLPVHVHVDGRLEALSRGLDLVAYRVVQEALTNVIKHAGVARARVNVSVAAGCVELEVSDNGHRATPTRDNNHEPGHGLVGMSERVRLYGGELHAGPRTDTHGFAVRARIPVEGIGPSPDPVTARASDDRSPVVPERGLRWRWLDPACAGVLLVALEIGVLTGDHRHGPLALNMLAVAAVALAAVWRRRSPLWFLLVVGALAAVMNAFLTTLDHSPLLAAYFLLVPAYTAAAWLARRPAVLALAFLLGSTAISELIAHHQPVDNLAGAAFTISAAWAAGRAIRARRTLISELQRTSARLRAEREDRAQLAVAGERSRIASELHAVVARSVAGMVIQAEGARSMLAEDPARADVAMGAIEDTGRQTLAEMRRILGVLRRGDDRAGREPQPGVAQVYSLIQRARERGQPVELRVDGEPGTVAAGVDLSLYRILEDALESARRHSAPSVAVTVRFRDEDLELRLTAPCRGPNAWPTDAMRERIALCDGALEDEILDEDGWHLVARMPRSLQ